MTPIHSSAVAESSAPNASIGMAGVSDAVPAHRRLGVTEAGPGMDPLQVPEGVDRSKISWGAFLFLFGFHAAAIAGVAVWLSAASWLFHWSAMIVMGVGFYATGCLGITLCYHRLLTHRSFKSPKWFERFLTLIAFCCAEGSSVRWVAAHRMHHKYSDHRPDPHSPWVDFFWGHMGWMLVKHPAVDDPDVGERYAKDLMKDPFHRWFDNGNKWLLVFVAHILMIFGGGFALGMSLENGSIQAGVNMGLCWVLWGVAVRMVIVWNVTWAINSVTHLWGYQNYKTTDQSRNNWLFGILAFGEGWHNNHHADQRSAAHGHKWWEFDITLVTIRFLSIFGLAKDIVMPARNDGTQHDLDNKKIE